MKTIDQLARNNLSNPTVVRVAAEGGEGDATADFKAVTAEVVARARALVR